MQPFVIFSLPRSRSTWLSAALSARGRLVGHDIGINCSSVSEFLATMTTRYVGTCETGAAFAAPLIASKLPEARFVVVLRNPHEVANRLYELGFGDQIHEMQLRYQQLKDIARMPNAIVVEPHRLGDPRTGLAIHMHLGLPFDWEWWAHMDAMNVQVDIEATKRKLAANHDSITALKAEVMGALVNA